MTQHERHSLLRKFNPESCWSFLVQIQKDHLPLLKFLAVFWFTMEASPSMYKFFPSKRLAPCKTYRKSTNKNNRLRQKAQVVNYP